MSDATADPLELELIELGRSLPTPSPREDLAALVLAEIGVGPVADVGGATSSHRSGGRDRSGMVAWLAGRRRRLVGVMAAAAFLVVALVPPVRAAVLELLRIGGVVVREVPANPLVTPSRGTPSEPTPVPSTGAPGTTPVGTLDEARRLVGFEVAVPAALGDPSTIAVTREGRVVEVVWGAAGPGMTRLEAFAGALSWGYLKTVWDEVTPTQVAGREAVWFGRPHLIEWVDHGGTTHTDPPRLAGPTLVWVVPGPSGDVTYRLEGPATLPAATAIAETAR